MASEDAEDHYETGWGWLNIGFVYNQYMWVWVWLLILTIVEVYVPEPHIFEELWLTMGLEGLAAQQEIINQWYDLYLGDNRAFVVVSLIVMALAKTWLVAWYYMHLISEKPAIILIAAAPFLFSVFLTIGLFPWGTTFGFEAGIFVP